jgi:hypothetical protein
MNDFRTGNIIKQPNKLCIWFQYDFDKVLAWFISGFIGFNKNKLKGFVQGFCADRKSLSLGSNGPRLDSSSFHPAGREVARRLDEVSAPPGLFGPPHATISGRRKDHVPTRTYSGKQKPKFEFRFWAAFWPNSAPRPLSTGSASNNCVERA